MDFINIIYNKLSYGSRRQKRMTKFNEKKQKYIDMPIDEFTMEYIAGKSAYEHKKILMAVISFTIILSMIILKQLLSIKNVGSNEMIEALSMIIITVIIIVVLVVVMVMFSVVSDMYKLSNNKFFLEEIKSMRTTKQERK